PRPAGQPERAPRATAPEPPRRTPILQQTPGRGRDVDAAHRVPSLGCDPLHAPLGGFPALRRGPCRVVRGVGPPDREAMWTVLVVVAVLIVRTLRWAMVVDGDGITIRNTWRTRSWTWAEIGEIGRDQAGVFILPGKVIAVCPLGDPYTYNANAT